MKIALTLVCLGVMSTSPDLARMRLNTDAGQPPKVLAAEPASGTPMARFQVFYIDDHSCPGGQIKKFTAGSKAGGIRATRECIAR